MESLRYLPWLGSEGWLITNTTPFINITNYPDKDVILSKIRSLKNNVALDADSIAKELNAPKSANMVILGAASPYLEIPFENIKNAVKAVFGRKGEEIVNQNIAALEAGRAVALAK
jgi:indolepyruvate ferredoxin oxidoreductase beta subunit